MPRELVHWDILHRCITSVTPLEYPHLAAVIKGNEAALALGAVAHDAPYYYRGGGAAFEWVGSFLHGLGDAVEGGDTLLPLSRFGVYANSLTQPTERAAALAFLLGLLSHYAVDVVFHPWIFFLTGNYYALESRDRAAARARHRLIEVYLDEDRRASIPPLPWSTSISTLRRTIPTPTLQSICAGLESAVAAPVDNFVPELRGKLAATWSAALAEMSIFQRLFVSPTGGILAGLLNRLAGDRLFAYEALFSRGRRGKHPVLHLPLTYKNPLSGAELSTSLSELDASAIALTTTLFRAVEGALASGAITPRTLSGGVSLNYGVKDGAPEDATHFSAQGCDLPGLRL